MEKESREGVECRSLTAPLSYRFDVALRLEQGGNPLLLEPITESDRLDLYSEVWLEQMRRGQPGLALEDLLLRMLPAGLRQEGNRCEGLLVEATAPDGETVSRRFGLHALAPVAARGAARLLQTGGLQPNQDYYYEIVARPAGTAGPDAAEPSPDVGGSFTIQHVPLDYLEYPLPPLLAQADAVGPVGGWSPVFYSHDLFIRADGFSRRGAASDPPEESGAVILGIPCSCPETGEFFIVATDVLEMEDTAQSTYSLSLSGRSWGRIQAAVKTRQAQPGGSQKRITGLCHGHNFYPCMLQGKDCRDCEKLETCSATSVFVSDQDQMWTRGVFFRQPWCFSHVFGIDTRGAHVHGLFGFQGGRMVQRGFHLLPEIPASLSGGGPDPVGEDQRED